MRYLGGLILALVCVGAEARQLRSAEDVPEGCNAEKTRCTLPAESLEPDAGNLTWPHNHSAEQALNPLWTRHLPCMYGELPGSWLPYMQTTIKDHKNEHQTIRFNKGFPKGISNVTHGAGWQLFSPRCKLHNYLHDYLMLRKPALPQAQQQINLLIMGDSVDRISVDLYFNILDILYNGTDRWKEVNPRRWNQKEFIVETDNGLNLYHAGHGSTLYNDNDERGVFDVQLARKKWKEWRPDGAEPDAILINAAYWDLHDIGTNTGFNQSDMIIQPAYLDKWMEAVSKMLRELRAQFPKSYIVWRTAPQTRVDVDSGEPAWHKEWAFKMHIAQINAAARHVTKVHSIPLVDLELICAGMTPTQANFDLHHPRDFFSMVYLNVFLNYVMQFLVGKGQL